MKLYWAYIQRGFAKNDEEKTGWNFEFLFIDKEFRKNLKLRSFESVSRCRRKIQAQCPELASDRVIRKLKKEQEKEFKEYARL